MQFSVLPIGFDSESCWNQRRRCQGCCCGARRRLVDIDEILAWHEDNIDELKRIFGEGPELGGRVYRRQLVDLLMSEISQLSALRESVARQGLVVSTIPPLSADPGISGKDAPGLGEFAEEAEQSSGLGAPAGPGKTTEPAPASEPRQAPDAEFPSNESADGALFDEASDVARNPSYQAALRSIAIATAASASLPAYDADTAGTRDFIGINAVADAFSYLLASRNAQPPLAIGLFGEWGSGKSFLMQAIRRRIDEITRGARQSGRPQSEIGVYKRVVQVEFNAWHYVEGNLWASLVDHIFANLRVMEDESVSELERRRRDICHRMASTTRQRSVLEKRIASLDEKRSRFEQEATERREGQLEQLKELQRLKLSDVAAAAKLNKQEKDDVTSAALSQIGLAQVDDTAIAAAQSLSEARALVHRGGAILAPLRSRNPWWLVAIIATICAAPLVAFALQKWNVAAVPKVLTALAVTASGAIAVFRQGMTWVSGTLSHIEAAEAKVRERVDAEAKRQAEEIARLEQAIGENERELVEAKKQRQDVDEQIMALRREVRELTPGRILAEFLDQRASSLDYQQHLGLTALIRRDFERLTALVKERNDQPDPDESSSSAVADFSRVVLFVDDLDRCPPRRVVEVLQAVHLLLSFPVFAVVVAVDPRWLSRSLQMQYKGLIEAPGAYTDASTARDYLEKVFQIPYRVAPLDPHSRALFMSGLTSKLVDGSTIKKTVASDKIEQIPTETKSLPVPAGGESFAPGIDAAKESANSTLAPQPVDNAASRHENTDNDTGEVDLNPSSLQLDDDEMGFLGKLLPILDSSPRGLKRYINIYRLIKAISAQQSPSKAGEARRRMFLLAVLTSFPYGSDVIAYIADAPSPQTQTVGNRITEYLNHQSRNSDLPECKTLMNWLAEQSSIADCPIIDTLDDARQIRLYSFT